MTIFVAIHKHVRTIALKIILECKSLKMSSKIKLAKDTSLILISNLANSFLHFRELEEWM
jgi:hypothetical protein